MSDYISSRGSEAPTNFDELADCLLTMESRFSPAELHGAVVGGLCGCMRLSAVRWAQFGLAVIGASGQIASQFSHLAESVVGGMAEQQLAILASEDLAFQPFLPDDEETIEARTEALSDWCKGFLGGFAEAQVFVQKQGQGETGPTSAFADRALPENVQEALSDLAAIAQASVTADDDEVDEDFFDENDPLGMGLNLDDDAVITEDGEYSAASSEDAESAERDYVEIVEYLRLATMTVFTEYGWVEILTQLAASAEQGDDGPGASQGAARFFKPGNKTMH